MDTVMENFVNALEKVLSGAIESVRRHYCCSLGDSPSLC